MSGDEKKSTFWFIWGLLIAVLIILFAFAVFLRLLEINTIITR